ncbi:hypothetical protein TNCV_529541 [Trichonephila clavipes]|nr:hypothetical protein TNCV_529541 [Trichonephila clavipes]
MVHILSRDQMTRTTSELAPSFPNFHATQVAVAEWSRSVFMGRIMMPLNTSRVEELMHVKSVEVQNPPIVRDVLRHGPWAPFSPQISLNKIMI